MSTSSFPNDSLSGPVVSSYTRQQAINDGMLIDVSIQAAAIGFKYPVAITDSVHAHYVENGGFKNMEACVVHRSILTDALQAIRNSIRNSGKQCDQLQFVAAFETTTDKAVPVFVHIGPGDTADPVITIMLSQDL
jgi:hypothetical protein